MIRPPCGRPDTVRSRQIASVSHAISICHPGYLGTNILLRLACVDDGAILDVETILVVCGILAGNRFDGWLSLDTQGTLLAVDAVIQAGQRYYFHLSYQIRDGNAQVEYAPWEYPIVRDFESWSFPSTMPEIWRQAAEQESPLAGGDTVADLARRDACCRVSTWTVNAHQAHIIPYAEHSWFTREDMGRFTGVSPVAIDHPLNKLILRPDIHYSFDNGDFVIVPKRDDSGALKMVVHVLRQSAELIEAFHNRQTHPLQVPFELIFARLAYTIFPLIRQFFDTTSPRVLITVSESGGYITRTFSPLELRPLAVNRSRSPRKRHHAKRRQDDDFEDRGGIICKQRRTTQIADSVVEASSDEADGLRGWGQDSDTGEEEGRASLEYAILQEQLDFQRCSGDVIDERRGRETTRRDPA